MKPEKPSCQRWMVESTLRAPFLAFILCIRGAITASAQNYSITSYTINGGGGGTSGGGQYSVEGTIAQHEANPTSTGGAYSISGGFFGQYMALQQTGAPHLIIRPAAGSNVEVVWGSNVPGWILQRNNFDLNPTLWIDVAGAPTVSGAEQYHAFASGGGRVFFRLRKL